MQRIARDISELIDALGGPTELACWVGLGRTAVVNWRMRGEIPPGWHLRLVAEARRRHITIDPQVFGLSDKDADALGPVLNYPKRKAAKAAA